MLSALRALIGAMPAILVLAGIFFMSRDAELVPTTTANARRRKPKPFNSRRPRTSRECTGWCSKQEAAIDMLNGLLTVDDEAARFLELSASDAKSLEHLRESTAGRTDEEKALQQLLAFARVQSARDPKRYANAYAQAEQLVKSRETIRDAH